jgi:hypothetical protein
MISRIVKIAAIRKIVHVMAAGMYSRLSSGKYKKVQFNIYGMIIVRQPLAHKMIHQLLYYHKQSEKSAKKATFKAQTFFLAV